MKMLIMFGGVAAAIVAGEALNSPASGLVTKLYPGRSAGFESVVSHAPLFVLPAIALVVLSR